MTTTWPARATLALVICTLTSARPALADTWHPLEAWRIENGSVAPWAPPGMRVDPALLGRVIRFRATRLEAPHPLECDGAKYEWLFGAAEGLFEGNLPEPQEAAAKTLGLGPGPYATLRISCTNAGFDFHRAPDGTLQLGLDNVVYTLRAVTAATTPAEIVQELLVTHFTHEMAFTRESVALKKAFLSARLQKAADAYFAKPAPPDEVPDIDGDPFTDTQEYPDRYTLGAVRTAGGRTTIPVHFAGEQLKRRV
ncbi:MAG: hypothetical protein U0P30_10635, partial [Vicinamibacterales bacterium]